MSAKALQILQGQSSGAALPERVAVSDSGDTGLTKPVDPDAMLTEIRRRDEKRWCSMSKRCSSGRARSQAG